MIILKRLCVARNGYICMSVVFYAAGFFCILLPDLSPTAVCICCGAAMAAYGVIKLIGYFSDDLFCLAFQYDLGSGLALIVLGAIVIGCKERIWQYLQRVSGLLILGDGMMRIQTAKEARKFGLETWPRILVCAIAAGILGALMIVGSALGAVSHQINGCAILAEGLMNHLLVRSTVVTKKTKGGEP